jgi:hypothetical protein
MLLSGGRNAACHSKLPPRYDPPPRFKQDFELYDERFTQSVSPNAWVERLRTPTLRTEGPVYSADGDHLVWSDIPG